ncbi:hypothetical protein ACFQU3_19630 [Terrabacter sp. GCM10028922]|uniref:hypothetical protein n=1 Tax=Terrabacter sp. GCM10028922 TaxID=3273428 RepID=UPI003623D9B8
MRRSRGALFGVVAVVLITGSAGSAAASNRSSKAPLSFSSTSRTAIAEFDHTDGCLRRGVTVFGDKTSGKTPSKAPTTSTFGFLEVWVDDICSDTRLKDEWGPFRPTRITVTNTNSAVLRGTVSIGGLEAPPSERTTYLVNLSWRRTGTVERSRGMHNVKNPDGTHILDRSIFTFAAASVTGSIATKKQPSVNILAGLDAAGQLQYLRESYHVLRPQGKPPA